jgi:hypothetical protein
VYLRPFWCIITPEVKKKRRWLRIPKYVTLEPARIETDYGVVCLESGDCFVIEKEIAQPHVEAGRIKPATSLLQEEYSEFKRILHELELVMDEIKAKNPDFANVIQSTINEVEGCYIKESYKGMVQANKNLKALYLMAIRGQY